MPKFQNTVRILFASWNPDRSASIRPRWSGGTVGTSCASPRAARAQSAATAQSEATLRGIGAIRVIRVIRRPMGGLPVACGRRELDTQLDPARREKAGWIGQLEPILLRKARIVRAAGGGKDEVVEELRVEQIE